MYKNDAVPRLNINMETSAVVLSLELESGVF